MIEIEVEEKEGKRGVQMLTKKIVRKAVLF
jgi:hypothetical protein